MSASMHWEPATPVEPRGSICLGLRHILAKHLLFDEDYHNLNDEELDERHIEWLTGVRDGASGEVAEDASELLAAIAEHKRIRLIISY